MIPSQKTVQKTFLFGENTNLKIAALKIVVLILFSISKFWFRMNSYVKLFRLRLRMHISQSIPVILFVVKAS